MLQFSPRPSGEVIGVDRDASTLAEARARVAAAGLQNVTFMESDVSEVASVKPFDAVVGRFILEFLPKPGAVVRSLSQLVRPGGILAFHDATWGPFLLYTASLPLRSVCASLIHQAFQRSGANTNMEIVLFRSFLEAGLPAPSMRIEIPVGDDPEFARWVYDILCSVRPQMQQHGLAFDAVGDFHTLLHRLETEAADAKTFGALVGLVGAWSRIPEDRSAQ
jgi:SAM-dependent methyltransferase